MKRPDSFLTNTTTATGRAEGEANNNPGDNSGTGMDKEIYNDPAYAVIGVVTSYKEAGLSNTDETTDDCDLRDAMKEMTEKAVSGVADWDTTTTFGIGDNCMYLGYQWVSYVAANQNNVPLTNPDMWMKVKKSDELLDAYLEGKIFVGGLQDIHDRAGTNYQISLAYGSHRIGPASSAFYNGYIVHLDGSTVTGNATLEAILDPGGANEHPYLDIIAPLDTGTRTLIDAGDYVVTPQSSGGDADTVGGLVEDQFQGHLRNLASTLGTDGVFVGSVAVGTTKNGSDIQSAASASNASELTTKDYIDDGTNGPPRTGSTTHGKRLTGGAAYIISMIPA